MAARKSKAEAQLLSLSAVVVCPNGHTTVLNNATVEADRGCYCYDGGSFNCGCVSPFAEIYWRCESCKPLKRGRASVQPYYSVKIS